MQLHTLTFDSEINFSLQVGDTVYYSPVNSMSSQGGYSQGASTISQSGFNTVTNSDTIVEFGVVTSVSQNSITVAYDNVGQAVGGPQPVGGTTVYSNAVVPPQPGDYIMFAKNKKVNSSSLKGYYAEVEFVNYSKDKIELFSVGSEVSESSK